LAAFLGIIIKFITLPALLTFAFYQILVISVVLAIFNLIPVHPLDGSKIILSVLPKDTAYEYERFMHQYGMWVLILLILPWGGTSPVSQLIWPVIEFIVNLLT